jgi:hypothetical protein
MLPDWEHMCLSAMLQDSESVVRPDLETVDGRSAAVLDVFRSGALAASVFLDVERNAVPLEWRMYRLHDGALRDTQRLRDYREYNGAWLPTRLELTWGPGSALSGSQVMTVSVQNGAPAILVNSGLSVEDCTVQFPPGAVVMDESAGTWFLAHTGDDAALRAVYASAQGSAPRASLAHWSTVLIGAMLAAATGFGLRFIAAGARNR